MKYLQISVRRSGQRAIRGWMLNILNLCPGRRFCWNEQLHGTSWFTYSTGINERIIADAREEPFITLESFPLNAVLDVVKAMPDRVVVICLRGLLETIASSYKLAVNRGDKLEWSRSTIATCYCCWRQYLDLDGIKIYYEPWVLDLDYRIDVAKQLGVDWYDGFPYDAVDASAFSKVDRISLCTRHFGLMNDPDFLAILRYIFG